MVENWRTKAEYFDARKQLLRELGARLLELQTDSVELGADRIEAVCPRCRFAVSFSDALEEEIDRVEWLIFDLYKKNSPTIGEVYPDGG